MSEERLLGLLDDAKRGISETILEKLESLAHAPDNTRKTGSQYALDQAKHTGGDGGQGRDRTADLPLFRLRRSQERDVYAG
jgi:hypothetical protein